MTQSFSARIVGREVHCRVGSDTALVAPVLCCSTVAPSVVVRGGKMLRSVAGYIEIALPNIPAGGSVEVVLGCKGDFYPKNRMWLPLGAYLRTKNGIVELPQVETGVRTESAPPRMAPEFAGLKLVPQPTGWMPTGGVLAFAALASGDARLKAADDLAQRLNMAPLLDAAGVKVTIREAKGMEAGGYGLVIAPEGIEIAAGDETGLHYAAITLLNLRETHGGALPCGRIEDAPRFGWRGQHLDCARHFYQVETILRLLDLMALLKLNRFHWHFADDEAFRLQVQTAPELWQKTAMRGEGHLMPSVHGAGVEAGGSYSPADVAVILERAKALQIEVLPEIEVPAHGYALNLAHPGMRDPGDNSAAVSVHGYIDNTINPAMPETWKLVEPLALEVAGMFPIGILHLGCDELPPDAWSASPAIEALKAREGLETRDDVQGWMMERLGALLEKNGFRSAAWEEAAKGKNGGLGHRAILFSWTGQGPGIEAARAGYDVVMVPAQNVYFDMVHTTDPEDWGTAWATPAVALEDVVNWKPVPKGAEDVAERIIGVQGCFWSEFTTKDAEMEPMLAPRILGLANKGWDKRDSVDGPGLRGLAQAYGAVFDRMGWKRHKGA